MLTEPRLIKEAQRLGRRRGPFADDRCEAGRGRQRGVKTPPDDRVLANEAGTGARQECLAGNAWRRYRPRSPMLACALCSLPAPGRR